MKKVLCIILLFISVSVIAAPLTTKQRVQHIRELVLQQKRDLDDAKNKLVWTHGELTQAQQQVDQIVKERDQWQKYGMSEHEMRIKGTVKILHRDIAIGVLLLGIGAYAVAKFYFHIPI